MTRGTPALPVVKQFAFLFRRMARAAADGPVDVIHWGHRLRLHTRGNYSEWTFLFMPDRWDRRERELLRRELRSGDVFVDVGANAGGYTWWVLHVLGRDCTVLAIEPEPALNARLRFNLDSNGFGNARALAVAVAPDEGEGWLELNPENSGENTVRSNAAFPEGRGIRVPLRRLSALVREAGVQRVDALKIDVEGLDSAILTEYFDAAPSALHPRIVIMEKPVADLMSRLESLGYGVRLVTPLNTVLVREAP
jgi:FkbM family methyltransferase